MEALYAWVFVLMTALLSPEAGAAIPTPKDNRETVAERTDRYWEISHALVDVVYAEDERPLFDGTDGRAKTAALLLAITYWESGGWNKVVDYGVGPRGTGDYGTSHCLAQVRLSPGMRTRHGFSAEDLVRDRRACFKAALALARDSFASCGRRVQLEVRLAVYASGRCDAGLKQSALRVRTAKRLFEAHPPPEP